MTWESMPHSEARSALADVERGRRRVVAQIGMPTWYWWGLALGWIAVGVTIDSGRPWLSAGATLLFGAAHAAAFSRVRSGRQRSSRVRVRASAGIKHMSLFLGISLLVLAAVTIVAALLARADGARHPVTMASVFVAVCILLGGPAAMGRFRHTQPGSDDA